MFNIVRQAQEYAAHRLEKNQPIDELLDDLELQFADQDYEFVLLRKGIGATIEIVYEDSRPNSLIATIKDYSCSKV